MGNKKGDTTHEQSQQQPQQLQLSFSPKNPLEESTEKDQLQHQQPTAVVVTRAPYVSAPVYVPIGATSSLFEHQFEPVNPKRQRYSSSQWKILPSPSQLQKQTQMAILTTESSPSPITQHPTNRQAKQVHTTTVSSSDTASSSPHSPIPALSAASGQETNKPESEQFHPQFRKGKYISPVWKPNEMLWLAKAWRIQYQGSGSCGSGSSSRPVDHQPETGQGQGQGEVAAAQSTRAKTRADKDKEVAEFLQRHGVNRDSKTAGTKWDNMLGEFRKVYEWVISA